MKEQDPKYRPGRPRRLLLGVAAAGLAVVMAACSSSKSSTTTTASSSATTATGDTTATTAAASTGLAAAQARIAKEEVQPTSITDTAKITGTIPKGKLVEFIPCGPNPECQQEGQIVAQAAASVGWQETTIPNDGTTQGDKAAFDRVVRDKPVAVLYTAIPQAVFQSDISAMKSNNTAVIACCVTDPTGQGVDYNIDAPDESAPVAQAQADFIAVDSSCKNADSVIINIPDFAILATGVKNFKDTLPVDCPGAQANELDISLANLATGPATTVSYLRAHPNVKYVAASTDGVVIGLPAALKAAGLNDVKIVGQGATPTNIQYLKTGGEVGDVAFAFDENMYAMFTAALEHAAGQAITPAVGPPLWVLTPSNAPTSSGIFPVVNDYVAQYKALWGVS